jgi:hypothetical protein
MNTSSRVPGLTRNSGWQAIDAEMAARRIRQQQSQATDVTSQEGR